jgi:IMP cyclohydrolase
MVSEPSDEMAAKRARTEVSAQSFDKIDVESLSVKVVEMKDGSNMYITLYDRQEVQIIMHPVEPAIVLRGFDMRGEIERRPNSIVKTRSPIQTILTST